MVVFDQGAGTRQKVERMLEEFEIKADTFIASSDHPLRLAYNPKRATPYFCHIERGRIGATGGVGTEAWQALVRKWQNRAEQELSHLESARHQ